MLFMRQQENSKCKICGKLARNKTFESWSRVLEDSGRLGHEWTMHCIAMGRGTGGILILQLISPSSPSPHHCPASIIRNLSIRVSGNLGIWACFHFSCWDNSRYGVNILGPFLMVDALGVLARFWCQGYQGWPKIWPGKEFTGPKLFQLEALHLLSFVS